MRHRTILAMLSGAVLLGGLALSACDVPFLPKELHLVQGIITVPTPSAQAAGDSTAECSVTIEGDRFETKDVSSDWAQTLIGRGDLASYRATCWIGTWPEDAEVTIFLVNLRSDINPPAGTYRVIEGSPGGWSNQENPFIAWSIADKHQVKGRYFASRSGTVEVAYVDADHMRITFNIQAATERNP